ncbi:sigma-54 interaction domain-containing protein [Acidiferrobacter thiooxydans]|uniref:sigma-54 interaction domain-containing protein n=1 Tax=Acidiferrobacter thiooxydans TaxID=163359 RepID=UPI001E638571
MLASDTVSFTLSRNRANGLSENRVEKNVIGASQAMKATVQRIAKISQSDAPVLIQGETGTGKELCALAVHAHSARSTRPFVAVNCGALPDKLIQSELFGHEKGAFTGAHQRKIGRIEAAEGGTLFLDEIGDLSLDLQVNLLRVLQGGTYERVGGTETLRADIRVIAATHVDMEKAVGEKRFREDLYYRLNVLNLDVPPLRSRDGDVVLLARHWFDMFAAERNPQVRGFSRDAFAALSRHHWPGNVRELINRVRRAMVMCERQLIGPEDLGLEHVGPHRDIPVEETLAEARERAEREAICEAVDRSAGNLSRAARSLGISRVTLYRLLDKYQIPHRLPRN